MENPTSRIVIFVLKSIKIYFGINSVVGSCDCKTRSGVKKPKCSSPTVKYRYMQVQCIKVQSKYNSILNLLLNEKNSWVTIFITIYKETRYMSCFIVIFLFSLKIKNTEKNNFCHKNVPNSELHSFVLCFFLKIVTHAEIQRFKWFYKGKRKYRTKFRFFCSPNLFYADKFLWSRSFTAKSIKKF